MEKVKLPPASVTDGQQVDCQLKKRVGKKVYVETKRNLYSHLNSMVMELGLSETIWILELEAVVLYCTYRENLPESPRALHETGRMINIICE